MTDTKRILNVIGTGSFSGMNITMESKKAAEDSSVLFIPESSGKNYALNALENVVDTSGKKKVILQFEMGQMNEERLKETADTMGENLLPGEEGTFITIGDPGVYSTFYTIREYLPSDIEIRVYPGISAPWSAAAAIGIPLISKGENLMICDEFPDDEVLSCSDTVAVLKTRGDKSSLLDRFENHGFRYWHVKRIGSPEETILTDRSEIEEDRDYMSLIIAKKEKNINKISGKEER